MRTHNICFWWNYEWQYLTPAQFAQGHEQKELLTSDSTCASY
uniref:Uncharacterized protein n=1 Tax=Ralstonia solanacearum TaxID=305 RepID=A0A0S4WDY7_RALSL|nr:protein of unknown function [Ralstonia solanacearum]